MPTTATEPPRPRVGACQGNCALRFAPDRSPNFRMPGREHAVELASGGAQADIGTGAPPRSRAARATVLTQPVAQGRPTPGSSWPWLSGRRLPALRFAPIRSPVFRMPCRERAVELAGGRGRIGTASGGTLLPPRPRPLTPPVLTPTSRPVRDPARPGVTAARPVVTAAPGIRHNRIRPTCCAVCPPCPAQTGQINVSILLLLPLT